MRTGTLTRHWDRCGECRAWRELRGLLGEVRLMVRFYGDYLIVCCVVTVRAKLFSFGLLSWFRFRALDALRRHLLH